MQVFQALSIGANPSTRYTAALSGAMLAVSAWNIFQNFAVGHGQRPQARWQPEAHTRLLRYNHEHRHLS